MSPSGNNSFDSNDFPIKSFPKDGFILNINPDVFDWNLLMIKVNLIGQVGIHGSEERIANYSR